MDGVLVVDKPPGITSHDVVATARRALRETRVGHTGTLDPMATGVLPLACGRATRLVQFLSASDKDYDADVRFGLSTDTYDITGRETARSDQIPPLDELITAVETFHGEYLQTPPAYSAKRIAGVRAYDLARADRAVQPAPVRVSVQRIELVAFSDGVATVRLTCSAGFYVRSLAHDLGARLRTGACLQRLRRTRSGDFSLDQAIGLEMLAGSPEEARARAVPLQALLPRLPTVSLTSEGCAWVAHGRELGASQAVGPFPAGSGWVRLLGPDGVLLGLARPARSPGLLHPSIVLT